MLREGAFIERASNTHVLLSLLDFSWWTSDISRTVRTAKTPGLSYIPQAVADALAPFPFSIGILFCVVLYVCAVFGEQLLNASGSHFQPGPPPIKSSVLSPTGNRERITANPSVSSIRHPSIRPSIRPSVRQCRSVSYYLCNCSKTADLAEEIGTDMSASF
jgi:hypothetical protein